MNSNILTCKQPIEMIDCAAEDVKLHVSHFLIVIPNLFNFE